MNTNSFDITREIVSLKAAADGAENRLRRNNLLFCGIPGAQSKKWTQSEGRVLSLCSELLGVTIHTSKVERAHTEYCCFSGRFMIAGRFQANKSRAIEVKFNHFKDKQSILASGNKLKNTDFTVREDFSASVRLARKKLEFTKEIKSPYQSRQDKLLLWKNCYVYDLASNAVAMPES